MTHEEEFEAFVGGADQEDDFGLCAACHDYPCCCDADDLMLHDDWQAEINTRVAPEETQEPTC